MPGKPLVELEGRAGLRCVADVPVELAGGLKPGAELAVRIETLAGPLTGTLAEISPAADPASRTVQVKVTLPAAEGPRAGQFARLAVPVGETTALRVPPAALVIRGQLEVVFVVADGRAQMRLVRAGKRSAQGVEILAGLTSGETVVVDGAAALLDGQPVQVR
jgi:RND family efflux transporter MFP subunit